MQNINSKYILVYHKTRALIAYNDERLVEAANPILTMLERNEDGDYFITQTFSNKFYGNVKGNTYKVITTKEGIFFKRNNTEGYPNFRCHQRLVNLVITDIKESK